MIDTDLCCGVIQIACAIELSDDVDEDVAVQICILLIPLLNSFASSIDVYLLK